MDSPSMTPCDCTVMLERRVSTPNSPPLPRKENQSTSKFAGERKSFIHQFAQCALCKDQIRDNQKAYMYRDQVFCCCRCRARAMAFDIEFGILQVEDKNPVLRKFTDCYGQKSCDGTRSSLVTFS